MPLTRIHYRVVGQDDYMLIIDVHADGGFVIDYGDYSSHKPTRGTVDDAHRSRLVSALAAGPARFGDIKGNVPGLSDRLLTSRLGELEAEGLVKRCRRDGTNCYGLTSKGLELTPAIEALEEVAGSWARREAPAERPGRIRAG